MGLGESGADFGHLRLLSGLAGGGGGVGDLTQRPPDPSPRRSMHVCVLVLVPAPRPISPSPWCGCSINKETLLWAVLGAWMNQPSVTSSWSLHSVRLGLRASLTRGSTRGEARGCSAHPIFLRLPVGLPLALLCQGSSRSFCRWPNGLRGC